MKNKRITVLIILALFSLVFSSSTFAQEDKKQLIQASYIIVFGRDPQVGEINYWMGLNNYNLKEYINIHYNSMGKDVNTKRSVIKKAYNDAYGRNPTDGEYTFWLQFNQSYTELMKRFVEGLTSNSADYENVIKRSYRFVYNREPNQQEINFWKIRTYSYIILVALHEEYKRQFGTGRESRATNVISGNGSLKTTPLSSSNALSQTTEYFATTFGSSSILPNKASNVIAVGGGNVIATGGGNVIATGGANVIASGGLN